MSFNPADLINEFRKSGLDPALFEKVDERHLTQAKNFLDWVNGPQFLNSLIYIKINFSSINLIVIFLIKKYGLSRF